MKQYGTTDAHFVTLAHKAHKMSVNNPYAVMSRELSVEEIKKAPIIAGPIRASMACPVACGAAAAIICSEKFVQKHNLQDRAIEIVAQALVSQQYKLIILLDYKYSISLTDSVHFPCFPLSLWTVWLVRLVLLMLYYVFIGD